MKENAVIEAKNQLLIQRLKEKEAKITKKYLETDEKKTWTFAYTERRKLTYARGVEALGMLLAGQIVSMRTVRSWMPQILLTALDGVTAEVKNTFRDELKEFSADHVGNELLETVQDLPNFHDLIHSWQEGKAVPAPESDVRPSEFTGLDIVYPDPACVKMTHVWMVQYDYQMGRTGISTYIIDAAYKAGIRLKMTKHRECVISKVLFNELSSKFVTDEWNDTIYKQCLQFAKTESSINLDANRPDVRADTVAYFGDWVIKRLIDRGLITAFDEVRGIVYRDLNHDRHSSIVEDRTIPESGLLDTRGTTTKTSSSSQQKQ